MMRPRFALPVGLALAGITAAWLLWPTPRLPATPAEPSFPVPQLAVEGDEPLATASDASPPDAGASPFLRVVSAVDQLPLRGAMVRVVRRGPFFSHPPPAVGTGTTDATGTVHFPSLPEVPLDVRVEAPYFEVSFGAFVPNGTAALKPLPPVRGVVLNADRTPAPGALITTQDAPVLQTTAGPDGRFSLPLATWGYVVGEKNGAVGVGDFLDPGRADSEVMIVLGAATTRTAHVVDRRGQPLEGVEVELRCGAITQHQLTDGAGAWFFPALKHLDATVTFTRAGYVPVEKRGSFGNPWEDVVLSRGAQLDGRVLNPDRSPVEGAKIEIAGMMPRLRPPVVTTDAQGRFSFRGLPFTEVIVWATRGEQQTNVEVELPDGERREVTVVLPPPLVEVGLAVVNEDGTEVEGWDAVATPVPEQGWVSHANLVGVKLCRGRFRFSVKAVDGRTAEATLDVDPKEDMPPLRVTVPGRVEPEVLGSRTLQVRVRTAAGQPVEGATVSCLDGHGVTGPDGTTSCEFIADEEDWPLHVVATLGASTGMTRATGREVLVEVLLSPRRTLRGRVLGQLPASGVQVRYHSATQHGEVELRGNSFVLEGIDPIRTFVCVTRTAGTERTEALGCRVAEGTDELEVTVGGPGAVELTVLDEQGKPLEAPVLYVDRERRDAVTAPKGEVRFETSPGTHVLVLNVEGRRARSETLFTVKSGEVTRLGTLRLQQ